MVCQSIDWSSCEGKDVRGHALSVETGLASAIFSVEPVWRRCLEECCEGSVGLGIWDKGRGARLWRDLWWRGRSRW